jgi:hypothetical protein
MAHSPMSDQALRSGRAQLARSLRRANPGMQFRFIRPGERPDGTVTPPRARKIRRRVALPEDKHAVAHRRGMTTMTSARGS